MPRVPGTKIWLRKKELNTICRAIEATPPMGRLQIAQDYALHNIRRARQAQSYLGRVRKFVIWYWFNLGAEGTLDLEKFNHVWEMEGRK